MKIKQKIFVIMLAVCSVLLIPIAAEAATVTGKSGAASTFTYDTDTGVLTISGSGKIEDTDDMKKLNPKAVVINSGITEIHSNTFAKKESITSVDLPETLTSMGCGVFYKCTGLKEIKIPASLETAYGIGDDIFGDSGLEKIEFAAGTKNVLQNFCKNATKLTTVVLPDGISEVRSGAFENCTSLAAITLPASVTRLGVGTFGGCTAMKEIVIPPNVGGIIGVSGYTFENSGVEKVTFAEGTKTICHNICGNMPNLVSVTLPDSVEEIGHDCFAKCPKLTSINIYANCKKFWDNIFAESPNVVITGYAGTEAEAYAAKNNIKFNSLGNLPPKMNEKANVGALTYKVINAAIDGTGQVSVVCATKKNIKSVTIPEKVAINGYSYNVKKIEAKAFYKQSKLKTVTIKSKGISKIGKNAFKGINAKATIKVPKAQKKAYAKLLKKAGVTSKMKIK